jgi:hypothetical protein
MGLRTVEAICTGSCFAASARSRVPCSMQNAKLFLSLPYACPEPVLVHRRCFHDKTFEKRPAEGKKGVCLSHLSRVVE